MPNNRDPIVIVLKNAFRGVVGLLILVSILALPYGGPLVLLYYSFYVLLYLIPLGLIVGAIFGLVSVLIPSRMIGQPKKKKGFTPAWSPITKISLMLIFVVLVGFLAFPYFTLGQNENVTTPARWHYVDATFVNSLGNRIYDPHPCELQIVLLVPQTHDQYELICDQALLDHLETTNPEYVEITYRVSFNFGQPHLHQLKSVDTVSIDSYTSKWIGGWTGCGRTYEHACHDPTIQDADDVIGGIKQRTVR